MPANSPVWHVFIKSSPDWTPTEHPGGLFTLASSPMHQSCAIYSTLVCPFLKHETSRARDETIRRGEGAIVGFDKYGLFMSCGHPGGDCPAAQAGIFDIGYFALAERYPYNSWKENLPLYEEAIAADAKVIDTATRLYWSDAPDDINRLLFDSLIDHMVVRTLRASASTVIGGHTYTLAVL